MQRHRLDQKFYNDAGRGNEKDRRLMKTVRSCYEGYKKIWSVSRQMFHVSDRRLSAISLLACDLLENSPCVQWQTFIGI